MMRANPTQVTAMVLSLTVIALLLAVTFPDDLRLFTAMLSIAAALMAVTVIVFLILIDIAPEGEAVISPIKSSLADLAGFLGAVAVLLVVVLTGKLP